MWTVCVVAGESQYALDLAVAEVVQAGVPVLVAAGNEDTDACLTSPARYSLSPAPPIAALHLC